MNPGDVGVPSQGIVHRCGNIDQVLCRGFNLLSHLFHHRGWHRSAGSSLKRRNCRAKLGSALVDGTTVSRNHPSRGRVGGAGGGRGAQRRAADGVVLLIEIVHTPPGSRLAVQRGGLCSFRTALCCIRHRIRPRSACRHSTGHTRCGFPVPRGWPLSARQGRRVWRSAERQ